MTQKLSAPLTVREQPEIFYLTFGMRTAGSATLLVNGTARSRINSRIASACLRKRRSSLHATDGLARPPFQAASSTNETWQIDPKLTATAT